MTLSKIGAHIIVPTDAARRMARVSPIVKCCDWSAAVLNEAPPGALKIYRAIVPLAEQEQMSPQQYLDTTLYRLGGVPVDAIESRNEIQSKIRDGLLNRIQWDIAFVKLAHQAGYKVVGGNDANGTMEEPEIKALVANNFCGWDYWATHEYYFDGQPFDGWTCLRYRKYHEWAGGQHPPMLVTEWGPQGKDSGGQGTDGSDLIQRMINYDAELVRDAYMLGATAFTFGPTEDWIRYGFDFDSRIDNILPLYPTNPTYSLPPWTEPTTGGDDMDAATTEKIARLLAQNAALTEIAIAFREGRLTGADGVDGQIALLRGGQVPDGYKPVGPAYPNS